jgi:microcin C transport system permease protein
MLGAHIAEVSILLIVFVAGAENSWFPTGGVISDHYAELSFWGQIEDRVQHLTLLVLNMIGEGVRAALDPHAQ